MDWLISQLVLLGQGPDGEESSWMQLLVFIVLAVFWAIGGIMKARAAKSQEEKQKRQTPPRPPRQRPSLERILDAQPEKARTRPMQAKAVKVAQQIATRDKADKQWVEAAVQAPEVDYNVSQPQAIADDKALMPAGLATVQRPEVEIATADQLRAAIVHYEIFGKCIALRGSEEQIWMR